MRISDWSSDVCSSDLVEKLDERSVKFTFEAGENRELPLIMGQLPVLPKHYWESRDFTTATLEPPLGSGPYRVKNFEPGRFEVVERVEDYWGKEDRKSVVSGKSVSVRVDLGGSSIIKKKNQK